ncbi:hypothetical protein CXG81DRAFT_18077 [Caulochytrium protostelioides]|uniref:Uncharacterized protein n=1 Tax=Caulochytrium protostelioides TaxID=1555241 RepID=A0A4P9XA94_9FUNG|nr:hypothetical protein CAUPRSCDRAFT_10758 [Caulochytrium protostelioides]RKP02252.1 hypothetical protein CXG81DRAFT_18077 [Caulochytrium protostelioides]|eukprot:RKP02252.1 hypothetical protein CXG81DRAFT_18077 [Caulochytrium protostelioides]
MPPHPLANLHAPSAPSSEEVASTSSPRPLSVLDRRDMGVGSGGPPTHYPLEHGATQYFTPRESNGPLRMVAQPPALPRGSSYTRKRLSDEQLVGQTAAGAIGATGLAAWSAMPLNGPGAEGVPAAAKAPASLSMSQVGEAPNMSRQPPPLRAAPKPVPTYGAAALASASRRRVPGPDLSIETRPLEPAAAGGGGGPVPTVTTMGRVGQIMKTAAVEEHTPPDSAMSGQTAFASLPSPMPLLGGRATAAIDGALPSPVKGDEALHTPARDATATELETALRIGSVPQLFSSFGLAAPDLYGVTPRERHRLSLHRGPGSYPSQASGAGAAAPEEAEKSTRSMSPAAQLMSGLVVRTLDLLYVVCLLRAMVVLMSATLDNRTVWIAFVLVSLMFRSHWQNLVNDRFFAADDLFHRVVNVLRAAFMFGLAYTAPATFQTIRSSQVAFVVMLLGITLVHVIRQLLLVTHDMRLMSRIVLKMVFELVPTAVLIISTVMNRRFQLMLWTIAALCSIAATFLDSATRPREGIAAAHWGLVTVALIAFMTLALFPIRFGVAPSNVYAAVPFSFAQFMRSIAGVLILLGLALLYLNTFPVLAQNLAALTPSPTESHRVGGVTGAIALPVTPMNPHAAPDSPLKPVPETSPDALAPAVASPSRVRHFVQRVLGQYHVLHVVLHVALICLGAGASTLLTQLREREIWRNGYTITQPASRPGMPAAQLMANAASTYSLHQLQVTAITHGTSRLSQQGRLTAAELFSGGLAVFLGGLAAMELARTLSQSALSRRGHVLTRLWRSLAPVAAKVIAAVVLCVPTWAHASGNVTLAVATVAVVVLALLSEIQVMSRNQPNQRSPVYRRINLV